MKDLEGVWNMAARYDLVAIPQHFDTLRSRLSAHLKYYRNWFEKIAPFAPVFHHFADGESFFSKEQNAKILAIVAMKRSDQKDLTITC